MRTCCAHSKQSLLRGEVIAETARQSNVNEIVSPCIISDMKDRNTPNIQMSEDEQFSSSNYSATVRAGV
jgi:hypothetical protein